MTSSIFNGIHNDRMTIVRYEKVKINNITKMQEVVKYVDIPCRLSKEKLSSLNNNNAPTITIAHKVFTGPGVDVLKGDKLIIKHKSGRIYTFKAGENFPYQSHLEIDVERDEIA